MYIGAIQLSIIQYIEHPDNKMFANTFNHRTRTITSRPLSLALSIDAELETVSDTDTVSSSSKSTFTTHSNDSAATLVNDILVLQIAKESKDYEPCPFTPLEHQHPLLRRQFMPLVDQHPLLKQQSIPSLVSIREAKRSSQYSRSSRSSRSSKLSSDNWQRSCSTRRVDGRDRYSTKPLVLESYAE